MSTCIRGGQTYKRHSYELRGGKELCKHCGHPKTKPAAQFEQKSGTVQEEK